MSVHFTTVVTHLLTLHAVYRIDWSVQLWRLCMQSRVSFRTGNLTKMRCELTYVLEKAIS